MNCINRWQAHRTGTEPVSIGCQACGASCKSCQLQMAMPEDAKKGV